MPHNYSKNILIAVENANYTISSPLSTLNNKSEEIKKSLQRKEFSYNTIDINSAEFEKYSKVNSYNNITSSNKFSNKNNTSAFENFESKLYSSGNYNNYATIPNENQLIWNKNKAKDHSAEKPYDHPAYGKYDSSLVSQTINIFNGKTKNMNNENLACNSNTNNNNSTTDFKSLYTNNYKNVNDNYNNYNNYNNNTGNPHENTISIINNNRVNYDFSDSAGNFSPQKNNHLENSKDYKNKKKYNFYYDTASAVEEENNFNNTDNILKDYNNSNNKNNEPYYYRKSNNTDRINYNKRQPSHDEYEADKNIKIKEYLQCSSYDNNNNYASNNLNNNSFYRNNNNYNNHNAGSANVRYENYDYNANNHYNYNQLNSNTLTYTSSSKAENYLKSQQEFQESMPRDSEALLSLSNSNSNPNSNYINNYASSNNNNNSQGNNSQNNNYSTNKYSSTEKYFIASHQNNSDNQHVDGLNAINYKNIQREIALREEEIRLLKLEIKRLNIEKNEFYNSMQLEKHKHSDALQEIAKLKKINEELKILNDKFECLSNEYKYLVQKYEQSEHVRVEQNKLINSMQRELELGRDNRLNSAEQNFYNQTAEAHENAKSNSKIDKLNNNSKINNTSFKINNQNNHTKSHNNTNKSAIKPEELKEYLKTEEDLNNIKNSLENPFLDNQSRASRSKKKLKKKKSASSKSKIKNNKSLLKAEKSASKAKLNNDKSNNLSRFSSNKNNKSNSRSVNENFGLNKKKNIANAVDGSNLVKKYQKNKSKSKEKIKNFKSIEPNKNSITNNLAVKKKSQSKIKV